MRKQNQHCSSQLSETGLKRAHYSRPMTIPFTFKKKRKNKKKWKKDNFFPSLFFPQFFSKFFFEKKKKRKKVFLPFFSLAFSKKSFFLFPPKITFFHSLFSCHFSQWQVFDVCWWALNRAKQLSTCKTAWETMSRNVQRERWRKRNGKRSTMRKRAIKNKKKTRVWYGQNGLREEIGREWRSLW